MFGKSILTTPGIREVLKWSIRAEAWWFDAKRGVYTAVDETDETAGQADRTRNFWYLPTRPTVARAILRDLPLESHERYSFVDFGSGKGRVLLIASEYPFRRIQGIELSKALHEQAVENTRRYSGSRSRHATIECTNLDATDYEIPNEPLVLYFFNPFGESVMRDILMRVDQSIELCPRDVLVVMHYPELSWIADAMPHLKLYRQDRFCRIYRSST